MLDVIAPAIASSTKAVVLMYGWLGSEAKHVRKYADMYVQKGCAVVYDEASIPTIVFRQEANLTKLVIESVRKAAQIVKDAEKRHHEGSANVEEEKKDEAVVVEEFSSRMMIPVVVHYFSNGGAFVAERLAQMIQEARSGKDADPDVEDLCFIAERLKERGFEVIDSAPVYLSMQNINCAIEASVPNLPLQILLKGFLSCSIVYKRTVDKIGKVFWNNMIESDLCRRQAFIYSTKDTITDSTMIDELIEKRKERGIQVIVSKFEDSDHVEHILTYPTEYDAILDQVLDLICNPSP